MDFQGLTIGHPGFDIWTMVYSATDPEYRATHLEADLRAYYDIISTYMEECPDFTQFMQELEENRILGMTMFGMLLTFENMFQCFLFRRNNVISDPVPNITAKSNKRVFKIFQGL